MIRDTDAATARARRVGAAVKWSVVMIVWFESPNGWLDAT